jgi:murein DD-endopeptidase MepM/ murein hydrolase activator NlpD
MFEYATRAPSGVPRTVTAKLAQDRYAVTVHDARLDRRVEAMGGEVRSSLYTAVLQDGGDAVLVNRFVDVFAWNIDFYRQPQRGDRWKVVVEKHYAGGRFLGFGDVLAAEYVNAGHVHRGFKYAAKDGKVAGIFDDEGQSLANAFLKSPLEIARITSSYGQRFHPVLRREKKHEGVDYGAATGTPFWAVADGVVKEARWSKTAGNMLVVRHVNGYETEYFHCSKFADGIRPGARVKQKQVIGYVGTTGRSTGPHLHFGMSKQGTRVDPQKQKFVKQKGVPKDHARDFQGHIEPLLELLKALDVA